MHYAAAVKCSLAEHCAVRWVLKFKDIKKNNITIFILKITYQMRKADTRTTT